MQAGPPQSLSVSVPSLMPSPQLLRLTPQKPLVQTRKLQSAALRQVPPGLHGLQAGPPQSLSVSVPFFIPSLHARDPVGLQRPPTHSPLVQSALALHTLPTAHGAQAGPPQSTSDSAPSMRPSSHEEGATGWQRPPTQLAEQQSEPVAQAAPSGWHGIAPVELVVVLIAPPNPPLVVLLLIAPPTPPLVVLLLIAPPTPPLVLVEPPVPPPRVGT